MPPHGHLPLDLNEIFDSDGDAVKRADGMAGSYGLIRGLGCKPGVGSVDGDEGVEFRFQAFDAAQVLVDKVDRGEAERGNVRCQYVHGKESGGRHGWLLRRLVAVQDCKSHRFVARLQPVASAS